MTVRAGVFAGLTALALLTGGCWRPLVVVRSAIEAGEAWAAGEPASGYRKLVVAGPRVRVVGHRGFSKAAPENTVAAFEAAIAAGADAVEFDVRLTRDGRPVVMHDATVDRTTDGHGRVGALPFAAVRRLDAGGRFGARFRGEKVPTLEEALDALRGRATALVEIKSPDRRVPGLVAKALAARGMADAALVISFHAASLGRVRALMPGVPIGRLTYPYDPPRRRALQAGCDAALAYFASVDGRAVGRAHRAGLRLFAWTVDDPAEMRRLARLGVDGLITDDVETARRVVAELKSP